MLAERARRLQERSSLWLQVSWPEEEQVHRSAHPEGDHREIGGSPGHLLSPYSPTVRWRAQPPSPRAEYSSSHPLPCRSAQQSAPASPPSSNPANTNPHT